MGIKASHPYVVAWQYIIVLSAILAFYLWPQSVIEHRLKAFFAVLIVLAIAFVHVSFNFKHDTFKAKEPLLDFEITIPGWLRLIWEIVLYSSAIWIYAQGQNALFLNFYIGSILALYIFSWDRTWLMLSSIRKKSHEI